MALKPSLNVLVALCLTASAALFFFGTGLTPVWMLLWLAPIPVLWLAPRIPAGQAFLFAAAAYVLGGFNIWFYMSTGGPGMGRPAQLDSPSLFICYRRCPVSPSRSTGPAVAGGIDRSRPFG